MTHKNESARLAGRALSLPHEQGSSLPIDAATVKQQTHRSDDRPKIIISHEEHEVGDAAVCALAKAPDLYQRGGQLVHVRQEDNGWRIRHVPMASLRERLAAMARWYRVSGDGADRSQKRSHPPDWVVSAVAARGQWPGVRELCAVVEAPALRPDGSVIERPGYDAATKLLFCPAGAVAPVPRQPTGDDVRRALGLLHETVADFPFASPPHRSAWLAGLLTLFARSAFDGPTPLFVLDANVRGSGKTLLADAVSLIYLGRNCAPMPPCPDPTEERKRITALATNGAQLVLLDNVNHAIGSGPLDAVLTATTWEDRQLGSSVMLRLPLRMTWWVTGNNVQFRAGSDTARRALHIRLQSPHEQPEQRSDFRHADLRKWIVGARKDLVWAALTLLHAYCDAGTPDQKLRPWGSFEGWSALVRGCLVWVGEPDPYETHDELMRSADRDADTLDDLLTGWQQATQALGKPACTVGEVLDLISQTAEPDRFGLRETFATLCGTRPTELPNSQALGYVLRKYQGRIVHGRRLLGGQKTNRGIPWSVGTVMSPGISLASSPPADRLSGAGV